MPCFAQQRISDNASQGESAQEKESWVFAISLKVLSEHSGQPHVHSKRPTVSSRCSAAEQINSNVHCAHLPFFKMNCPEKVRSLHSVVHWRAIRAVPPCVECWLLALPCTRACHSMPCLSLVCISCLLDDFGATCLCSFLQLAQLRRWLSSLCFSHCPPQNTKTKGHSDLDQRRGAEKNYTPSRVSSHALTVVP
jgi:hypothetical protein